MLYNILLILKNSMIQKNIQRLKDSIGAVCQRAQRDPDSITILAVSKARPSAQIKEVIEAGIADIAENRVQEAVQKYQELYGLKLRTPNLKWHMVGHLQSNKVKEAVKIFDLIHSLDSQRLAEEIDRQSAKIGKLQDVLIQVNTSGEQSKFGLGIKEAGQAIKQITRLDNINVVGLMTIAPFGGGPGQARPFFKMLRELKDMINQQWINKDALPSDSQGLRILSMGMSDDFEAAIEEGSNMLRIGRAIFEG